MAKRSKVSAQGICHLCIYSIPYTGPEHLNMCNTNTSLSPVTRQSQKLEFRPDWWINKFNIVEYCRITFFGPLMATTSRCTLIPTISGISTQKLQEGLPEFICTTATR